MDYNTLLDLATDLGYELSMCGAETFRVEESVSRILSSYGIKSDVYAIPSTLIVSIVTETGKPITRMRRIGYHGNDLDGVEKFNALSRAICNRHPSPSAAMNWLEMVQKSIDQYSLPWYLAGNFLGAAGFSVLFGCSIPDLICSGFCGVLGGLLIKALNRFRANSFFSTLAAAFLMSLAAYWLNDIGIAHNANGVVIGALMILVPGLLFTNAMRDFIYGDINSGINRFVQVLLIAFAMSLGTAVAWNAASHFWSTPVSTAAVDHSFLILCCASAVGCIGFSILFNIHGPGGLLCILGGVLTWAVYDLTVRFGFSQILGYFWGAFFASLYAEIMARVRKYPAISYLVVSIFPLIPGAGIYYTMYYAVHNDMNMFAIKGTETASIAGVMAVGILLVSTTVRMYYTWVQDRNSKRKTRE